MIAAPLTLMDARLVREAVTVLEAIRDSGVDLPANWRWPLLDELEGVALALEERAAR